ncbi:hypothetical protein Rfer_4433 (plasmid) [Rhodoferax ferrireducens T118]|uniref:Uncharacterized protein n=1 Tax=Albidiferax ferrireducens (strain ATCC BAA-621 / DSM 15236 / T118) TaxID=338969 RepID=Q21Q26_ALBFT|nr:hypothetical protein [Rhodoferax ferrireducens]ABD72119.1 hypothetical protein Rfer_4433 [Rhodoferax ferrireducens T118]
MHAIAQEFMSEPNPFGWMSDEMARAIGVAAARSRTLASRPESWLQHALATEGDGWVGGEKAPLATGNYERLFVDGVMIQLWDGESWRSEGATKPHWRQVGDYPSWRGLQVGAGQTTT